MAPTLIDPLLGHLIDGRYEVLSRIARGGMATVYLAKDRRLDRDVALKVMHQHLAEGTSGSEFVARFRREARSAAKLTHPGLVGVLDQGVDGETSYLTMEYVEGTNLRRHLGEHGSLSVGQSLSILEHVLDALTAAHRADLVHRDIKPENVLLAADGRIKVADFGLARAVTEVTSTTTGTILGTVAYLAPELVAHGVSDARTDVYACGILLYEMLTGAQPFTGVTPIQIAYQHVHAEMPAPSDAVPWLPAELDELVGALAARDPQDRPLDARAALALVRRTHDVLDEATLERRADVVPATPPPGDRADPAPKDGGTTGGAVVQRDHAVTEAIHVDRPGHGTEPDDGRSLDRTMALKIGTGLDPEPPADEAAAHVRGRWHRVLWVLLAVSAVTGFAWWFQTVGPGAYTAVPGGLVGAEQAVAERVLVDADLVPRVVEVFDPVVAQGLVVSTDPGEGERVRKEGTVEVAVSQGPDLRTVPVDLPGKPVDEVIAALVTAGFTVPEPTRDYDDVVALDHVISVSAAPGAQLPVGTQVLLVVSDGFAPLEVSSVVGIPFADAKTQLEAQGLQVVEAQGYSEDFGQGVVMAQEPAAGTPGFRRDTVTVTVSQGPPLVQVPDLFGQQYRDAAALLESLGLVPARDNFLGGVFGTVRAQDVAAGESIPKGSTVTLTVV